MIQIFCNIYVGDENDAHSIINKSKEWAILHCCKNPFHCEMVGYKGNLPKTHPNYAFIINDNRMALNLVDMDNYNYDEIWHNFFIHIFNNAFNFIDKQILLGKKILIHCNQGESRAPSVALLYLISKGQHEDTFENTVKSFKTKYPLYNPKAGIYGNIRDSWQYYTSVWACQN